MDAYRLKIRIGEHEFEAEGPQEAVERQFEAFKELIASVPRKASNQNTQDKVVPGGVKNGNPPAKQFDNIFKVDGRVVSLTAPPKDEKEGALVILIGQKIYRNNDTPTGSEIADGLRHSGYSIPGRVDRTLESFVSEGLLIKMGNRKGTRYRLTNTGLPRAEAIAREIQSTVG